MKGRSFRLALHSAALALTFALLTVGTGFAAPGNGNGGNSSTAPGQQSTPPGQGQSNGNGANTTGPYDPSGVGAPSGNGRSTDNNGKRPCAGCVGSADTKNPPGQLPGGSDANRGYECDENQGVGKTNPAHSGCVTPTGFTPPDGGNGGKPPGGGNPPGDSSSQPTPPGGGGAVLGDRTAGVSEDETSPAANAAPVEGAERLPFTGGEPLTLALLGALALLAAVGLRRRLGREH